MERFVDKRLVFSLLKCTWKYKDVLTTLLTKRLIPVCDVMDLSVIFKFQNFIFKKKT